MLIYAHVHEKTIPISCGPGVQPVKWLGHVGIARYDDKVRLQLFSLPARGVLGVWPGRGRVSHLSHLSAAF